MIAEGPRSEDLSANRGIRAKLVLENAYRLEGYAARGMIEKLMGEFHVIVGCPDRSATIRHEIPAAPVNIASEGGGFVPDRKERHYDVKTVPGVPRFGEERHLPGIPVRRGKVGVYLLHQFDRDNRRSGPAGDRSIVSL